MIMVLIDIITVKNEQEQEIGNEVVLELRAKIGNHLLRTAIEQFCIQK